MIERVVMGQPQPTVEPVGGPVAQSAGQPSAGVTAGQPQGLYAGKFKDDKELEKGYVNLYAEQQRAYGENAQLKQRLDAATALLEGLASGRDNPADRASRTSDLDELAEANNIDKDKFVRAIASVVQPMIAQTVSQQFAPLTLGTQAREILVSERPDYLQHEGNISQYLREHPEVKARVDAAFRGDPSDPASIQAAVGALDYAYLRAKEGVSTPTPAPKTDASGLQQYEARLDAALPGGGGGISRTHAQEPANDRAAKLQQIVNAAGQQGWTRNNVNAFLDVFLTQGGHVPQAHTG